jgi:hypothetical protein
MIRACMALALVAIAACGCERSASYFVEHPDVAKQVLADCQRGTHRGPDCEHALAAEAKARSEAAQAVWRSMQKPNPNPTEAR